MRHDFETAVARLINTDVPDNVTGVKRFNLTLDGDAVEDGASGLFLTVTTLDNTVRLRMRRATPHRHFLEAAHRAAGVPWQCLLREDRGLVWQR